MSFTTGLTILFVGLKLTGYVHWSWLWVLAPTWLPLLFLFVFGLAAAVERDNERARVDKLFRNGK